MTTYPLATVACTIDATGISAPPYSDILASKQAQYRSIYGSDVYLDADSQDGQKIALEALAQHDTNNAMIAVYNSQRPSGAQGAGLSSLVKLNGISRLSSSNSTVDQTIVGDVGTIITNGQVGDGTYAWTLPATVTIPSGGVVVVTATCTTNGAVAAAPGTINRILTPTRGWQSTGNGAAATTGAPVETDAQLRLRQSGSTAQAAETPLDTIISAVSDLPGVQRLMAYENDTGSADANGIPAHSISLVIQGGDDTAISKAIANKKNPGTGTFGTTAITVTDPKGVPNTIRFYRPTSVRISAEIDMTALPGYVTTTGQASQAALAAYVSGLAIGGDIYQSKAVGAADLVGDPRSATFNITMVKIARYPTALGTSDVPLAFNEAASLSVADIVLAVS